MLKMVRHECKTTVNGTETIVSMRDVPDGVPCFFCDQQEFFAWIEGQGRLPCAHAISPPVDRLQQQGLFIVDIMGATLLGGTKLVLRAPTTMLVHHIEQERLLEERVGAQAEEIKKLRAEVRTLQGMDTRADRAAVRVRIEPMELRTGGIVATGRHTKVEGLEAPVGAVLVESTKRGAKSLRLDVAGRTDDATLHVELQDGTLRAFRGISMVLTAAEEVDALEASLAASFADSRVEAHQICHPGDDAGELEQSV